MGWKWPWTKRTKRTESEAPGWDAITAALRTVYGGQEPLHWGTIINYRLGGPDPLDGISAYRADRPAHWHFVSFGLSELYDKESDVPGQSGWGFELTFRLARHGDERPPAWALNFLQNLARYVCDSGNAFAPGHQLDLNGPIALDEETAVRAVAFAVDPQLGTIDTPHGRLTFLQVVGLTLDELETIRCWNTDGLLALLRAGNPLLVTDLRRASALARPEARAAADAGMRAEGSRQEVAHVSRVEWSTDGEPTVTLGATAVRELHRLLPWRLPFGRPFTLAGKVQNLRIAPGPGAPGWQADGEALVVTLPVDACGPFLQELPPRRGTYRSARLPGLLVKVIPSEIKDADGNVVETVG